MPRVTYISHDETAKTLDIDVGTSVMQAAIFNGIDGIVAECGGSCMCATCHVYVREDQLALTPPMEADEDAMLEGAACERRPSSRLSCQLVVSPEMDGLVVHLPETQI
jgi:2Fe-2S ferredoxin